MLKYYAKEIIQRKELLLRVSKYVVADAFFSRFPFVEKLVSNGFEVVSRLRSDSVLRYLYKGERKKGRGRPKKYDGKVEFNNLNMKYFKLIKKTKELKVYHGKVYSNSLKRTINLVIVYIKNKNGWTQQLYFSTDLSHLQF